MSELVLGRIRPLPERFNLLQLVAPQFVNFLVECQWVPLIRKDGESIINKLQLDPRDAARVGLRRTHQSDAECTEAGIL